MIFVVQSEWNSSITDSLAQAALEKVLSAGYACRIVKVPGALEIPLAVKLLWEKHSDSFLGAIACACIIKGDTQHFEIVANESARGLMDVSLQISRPVTNAMLAVYKLEDAIKRAQAGNNKGEEAASALLSMLNWMKDEENSR